MLKGNTFLSFPFLPPSPLLVYECIGHGRSKVSSNRPDSSSAGFSGHVENLGPRGHHWTYVFGSDDLEDDYTTYANDAVPLREVLPQGGLVGEGSQSPTPDDIRQGFGEPLRSSSVLEGNPASSSRAVQNKDLDFVEEVNLEWADRYENWGPVTQEPYDKGLKTQGGQAHLVAEY